MQQMTNKKSPLLAGGGPILNLIWESPSRGDYSRSPHQRGDLTPPSAPFAHLSQFVLPSSGTHYTFLYIESLILCAVKVHIIYYIFYFTSVQ